MTFTRRMEPQQWLDQCYNQIAQISLDTGFSIQTARDGVVLIDALLTATGEREPSNIVNLAEVRAAR